MAINEHIPSNCNECQVTDTDERHAKLFHKDVADDSERIDNDQNTA